MHSLFIIYNISEGLANCHLKNNKLGLKQSPYKLTDILFDFSHIDLSISDKMLQKFASCMENAIWLFR